MNNLFSVTASRTSFASLLLSALLVLIVTSSSLFARGPIRIVTGTVTKVSDGDTIHVTTPEQTKLKVRLYGIDAPETTKTDRQGFISKPGQPYSRESWKALVSKVMWKHVRLEIIDIDRYRRMVCMVWIDDRNLNHEMVREGYAEAYIEYLKEPYRSDFLSLQQDAQVAKRGIWSLPDYKRPSDFKRRLKVRGG